MNLSELGMVAGNKVAGVSGSAHLVSVLQRFHHIPCKTWCKLDSGSWKSDHKSLATRTEHGTQLWCRRRSLVELSVRCCVVSPPSVSTAVPTRTQRIMESIGPGSEAGGAGGSMSYSALKRLDEQWLRLRSSKPESGPAPQLVRRIQSCWAESDLAERTKELFDVTVCGGTLGIFVAAALALQGLRVAVVEKGILKGRVQEWNISRKELYELVDLGVLTSHEAEEVINIEFNPNRCGFLGGVEVWLEDILNLGVSPLKLIEAVKQRFLAAGGTLIEGTGFSRLDIFEDGTILALENGERVVSRLVVDAMGNYSPIVRQIRWGQIPDGICLVVGTCARGFENNAFSDVIYTNTPIRDVGQSKTQYFWEAFPSGSGPKDRTTYMFTYLDATPDRPSLEDLLEEYWELMPDYQGIKLDDVEILRVLFGVFPTYRSSPLQPAFDRVLQIGDASGIQSPISFGGFGAITRHLKRLSSGLVEALQGDLLEKGSLALINPYQPNLSGAWLLQRAMSVRTGRNPRADFINRLLSVNFQSMQRLGDPVIRPFLQDVTQFWALAKVMGSMVVTKPDILPEIVSEVGPVPLVDWVVHFVGLGTYTFLSSVVAPALRSWVSSLPKKDQYVWNRRFEAWQYGSGLDFD